MMICYNSDEQVGNVIHAAAAAGILPPNFNILGGNIGGCMSMYVRIAFFYLLVTHSVRACALNLRLLNFMEQLVSNLQPPYNPPFAVRCPASPNPPVPLAGLGLCRFTNPLLLVVLVVLYFNFQCQHHKGIWADA